MRFALMALVATFALGCGPKTATQGAQIDPSFECNNRRMAYELTGGFGAYKTGVAATCASGPQVILFRQESADAERDIKRKSIGSDTFEKLWEAIDSTGWRHIEDCEYQGMGDDPTYVIMIGDHAADAKIDCAAEGEGSSKKLQFPHENIVNELDLAAGGLR